MPNISMNWPQYLRGECTVDGRRVSLSGNMAELLFALLVSGPDRFVSRYELVEIVWPDADEQPLSASCDLNVYVHRLRAHGIEIESEHCFGWRIPRWAREDRLVEAA